MFWSRLSPPFLWVFLLLPSPRVRVRGADAGTARTSSSTSWKTLLTSRRSASCCSAVCAGMVLWSGERVRDTGRMRSRGSVLERMDWTPTADFVLELDPQKSFLPHLSSSHCIGITTVPSTHTPCPPLPPARRPAGTPSTPPHSLRSGRTSPCSPGPSGRGG
jgi:hypothetical protein